jgi:Ca2+-binding EF-hand superfamily protein
MKTNIKMVVALLVVSSITAAGIAQGQRGGGQRGSKPTFDSMLSQFDSNKNGVLEKSEAPGRMWTRLQKADSNGDGSISRQEYDAFKGGIN